MKSRKKRPTINKESKRSHEIKKRKHTANDLQAEATPEMQIQATWSRSKSIVAKKEELAKKDPSNRERMYLSQRRNGFGYNPSNEISISTTSRRDVERGKTATISLSPSFKP